MMIATRDHLMPSTDHTHRDPLGLPLAERFDLAQQLLDSVRDELATAPLTPEQHTRVCRTLAGIDDGSILCEPFDHVMQRLRSS